MTNILSIPEEISDNISFFKNSFSKPQFCRFSNQILGRMTNPRFSTYNLPEQFFHKVNPSTENRFLTKSPWKDSIVESKLYNLVEQSDILPEYRIIILDDTLSHKKYAKEMEGVGKHHDHLNNTYSNGHSVVTVGIESEYGCVPLASKVYVKKEDIIEGIDFKTKNEIAKETITKINKHIPVNLSVMDSWYGNNANLLCSFVDEGIDYVAAIKSNRNITFRHRKSNVGWYFSTLQDKDFEIYYTMQNGKPKEKFRLHKINVFMSNLGNVDLLVSQMWLKKDKKWSEPWFVITNLKEKSSVEILRLYLKRNPIESFHREAKQELSMEKSLLRKYKGIVRNLFLVVVSYVFLMLIMKKQDKSMTIRQACNYTKKCCETVSINTVINADSELINRRDVRENLGLAA